MEGVARTNRGASHIRGIRRSSSGSFVPGGVDEHGEGFVGFRKSGGGFRFSSGGGGGAPAVQKPTGLDAFFDACEKCDETAIDELLFEGAADEEKGMPLVTSTLFLGFLFSCHSALGCCCWERPAGPEAVEGSQATAVGERSFVRRCFLWRAGVRGSLVAGSSCGREIRSWCSA